MAFFFGFVGVFVAKLFKYGGALEIREDLRMGGVKEEGEVFVFPILSVRKRKYEK